METLMVVWEGYEHCLAYRCKMVVTRVFGIISLQPFYDYGRLPLHLGGGYGRVTWTAERGLSKWLNFRTWQYFREEVFQKDDGKCIMCGKPLIIKHGLGNEVLAFVCDHKIPLFKDGKDWWEDPLMTNFQTLCEKCNKVKTAMDKAVPKKAKEKANIESKLVSLGCLFKKPVDFPLDTFLLISTEKNAVNLA